MSYIKVMGKLLQARKIISETKMEKKGFNNYSNYKYFTPDQVHTLVEDASQKVKILPMYSLERTELGYNGVLYVADTESGEYLTFEMATDMPEIKATNAAQKLGGMTTYNERYLKMSAFGIVDNNLDLDNHDNRPPKKAVSNKVPLTDDKLKAMITSLEKDYKKNLPFVEKAISSKYYLTDEQSKKIEEVKKTHE